MSDNDLIRREDAKAIVSGLPVFSEHASDAENAKAVSFIHKATTAISTLPAVQPSPDVVALVEAAQWARNRLEQIADESWYGDGRDLKRSIIGVFADFDEALARCGSYVPAALDRVKGDTHE